MENEIIEPIWRRPKLIIMKRTAKPTLAENNLSSSTNVENIGKKPRKLKSKKREELHHIERDAYSHPIDSKLHIYPERKRHTEHKTEQIEIEWFDKEPTTIAEINGEIYALRELDR